MLRKGVMNCLAGELEPPLPPVVERIGVSRRSYGSLIEEGGGG
jgi:hypothetical protein